MALTGNELILAIPVAAGGGPSAVSEYVTTQSIANLGGGGGGTPGGSTGQLQGNNAGAFAGVPNSTINFTTGAVQIQMARVAVTGTSKTFALTDANATQDCSNASAQTLTIPLNATVAFPVGTIIPIERNGAGTVTITAISGAVTLNGVAGGSITIGAQYTGAYLVQESANVWYLQGGIGANITSTGITIDGGGSTITLGSKGFIQIEFACNITNWTILGDQTGSTVIDVKRSTYAGFPTTASLVGGGNAPTLSSAQKNTAAPTGWTSVAIAAGDILEYSVTSATTVTRVNLVLTLQKT